MRLTAIAAFAALTVSAWAVPPVPRKAPEFTIVLPDGKQQLLSSYKGKVIAFAFMATWCPHCQEYSKMLTRLHRELGPRGFQPLGVAFNSGVTPAMVNEFIGKFGVDFPVGVSAVDPVLSYLGISAIERYGYPQVVLIDRKGMIRAQSPVPGVDAALANEVSLRSLIEGLLAEGATTTTSSAKKPASSK